ncbi:hypothetical protein DRH14_01595, partial [Candidatus Shapirobacteria bacterium]
MFYQQVCDIILPPNSFGRENPFSNRGEFFKMKIRFLGTNGWYNTHIANTTCIFIETGEFYLILDAGDGFYKVGRFIKQRKPIYLFLSHFHLDHISGLHTLNKFTFPQGLKIYGYKGMSRILNRVICSPYTVPFSELSYPVELLEIEEGRHNSPFPFTSLFLLHSVACFGYRLEIEGKTIAYCPDTGVCENALRLSENADLLLCECSLRTGEFKEEWPHLNPHTAAQI